MCIVHIIAGTDAEYQSQAKPTKHTPYLALTGELWGVFHEYFGENWPRYNGTTLYWKKNSKISIFTDPMLTQMNNS